MRGFKQMSRFSRGVVTDAVPTRGALLEARDMMPLDTELGWRRRGGKGVGSNVSGASAGGIGIFPVEGLAVNTYDALVSAIASGGVGSWPYTNTAAGTQLLQQLPAAQYASGLTTRSNQLEAVSAARFGRELWCVSQSKLPMRWAGANGSVATYSTGTVSTTSGSSTVTGSGTTWTTSHVGCYLWINDATLGDRAYRITAFVSATEVMVDRNVPATSSGKSYTITNVSWWSVKPGTFGGSDASTPYPTSLTSVTAKSYLNARCVVQHRGRVFAGCVVDNDPLLLFPDRLRWSAVDAEEDGEWGGAELWNANAYVDVAPGKGGDGIRDLVSLGSTLFVLKASGVFALRGYVATDGTDEGAQVELITLDAGLYYGLAFALDDVAYFLGLDGVYELREGAIRNLSKATGAFGLWEEFRDSGGVPSGVSVVGDRLIVHKTQLRSAAVAAGVSNVLVFDLRRGVWSSQQSFASTTAHPNGLALTITGEAGSASAKVFDWDLDLVDTYDNDGGVAVLGQLVTHPIGVGGRDANGRVRAVQVRSRLTSSAAATLETALLLGEEPGSSAVEAAVVGAVEAAEDGVVEGWSRLPVRSGAPPLSEVQVRLRQTAAASLLRVYEVGVESVGVARFR